MDKNLILTKAQNAVLAHDWTTAARLYKELLKNNETNVDYLNALGNIYVKAGEDEKAIQFYKQIIENYPHYIDAMNNLGAIYRRLRRYEESIEILQSALKEDRNLASVNYNLGFTYKEMGKYDEAIDAFESVIVENSDDVLAYNHLGSIYLKQKKYEKSIMTFKHGLQVDPNHPILNYNLARCYEVANQIPDSIRCYEAALKTRPGWTDAIKDFSKLLVKCQRSKQAQELVEQSIKLHPTDTGLLNLLGKIFLNQFDYDNAKNTFKKAESIDSNNVKILSGLAEALEKGGKVELALEKVLDALAIESDNKDIRKQYVHTLLSAQNYDEALETVKALYEEDQKDLQVLDLYGQYYICQNDDTNANAYYEKIKRINHHYKDYMLNAADRYMQKGNYEKAENFAQDFIKVRENRVEGHNKLGQILEAKGLLECAKKAYEKGLEVRKPNILATKQIEKLNEKIEQSQKQDEEIEDLNEENQIDEENLIAQENDEFNIDILGENAENENSENSQDTEETQNGLNQEVVDENDDNEELSENFDDLREQKIPLENDDDFWDEMDDEKLEEFNDAEIDNDENEIPENEDTEDDIFGNFAYDSPTDQIEDAKTNEQNKENPIIQQKIPNNQKSQNPNVSSCLDEDFKDSFDEDFNQDDYNDNFNEESKDEDFSNENYENDDFSNSTKNDNLNDFSDEQDFENSQEIDELPKLDDDFSFDENPIQQMEEPKFELPKKLENQPKTPIQPNYETPRDYQNPNSFSQMDRKMQDFAIQSAENAMQAANNAQRMASQLSMEQEQLRRELEEKTRELQQKTAEIEEKSEEIIKHEVEKEVEKQLGDLEVQPNNEEFELDSEDENSISNEEIDLDSEFDSNSENSVSNEALELDNEFDSENEKSILSENLDSDEEISLQNDDLVSNGKINPEDENSIENEEIDLKDESFISNEENNCDLLFPTVDELIELLQKDNSFLEKVERILTDNELAQKYSSEIELLKKLKVLTQFLPKEEKNEILSSKMNMLIEYLLSKMSGNPGLLITAESLIKSGVLGKKYDSQLESYKKQEMNENLISKVLCDMKNLSKNLPNQKIATELQNQADRLLEKLNSDEYIL